MQLCSGGDSGVFWPDSGGLLPQREQAGKKKLRSLLFTLF